jgi:methionyl-tRNA formyltransferase
MSSTQPIRVVFLGTPEFALPTFNALLEADDIQVLGVVTQPDKPAGRGKKLTPPPVKERAESAGIPVQQPKSLRKDETVKAWLKEQAPDFLVTAAFGQILPQDVLDIPKFGTVNVHASLLPALRGANPIQWAVIAGLEETGITTMLTDIGVDTGDILQMAKLTVGPDETAEELTPRLAELGAPLLVDTLRKRFAGTLESRPQDNDLATHAPKLCKELAQISWHRSALELHNRIRGQQPWPGAQALFDGETLKLLGSTLPLAGADFQDAELPPGTIIGLYKNAERGVDGLAVKTGNGVVVLTKVQPPGKKPMSAKDWANGALGPLLKQIVPGDAATYPSFDFWESTAANPAKAIEA